MSVSSSQRPSALEHQARIYLRGGAGLTPPVPVDPLSLEEKAQKYMSPAAAAYIIGGAGRERTIAFNRQDFDRWQIVPRMLRDVGTRDTSSSFLGQTIASPLMLAPIGVLEMVHKKADLAVAAAATATGTPMVISNQASFPMESIARVLGETPRMFQLYWSKSNELVKSLVKRAEDIGSQAIVLTLDTTMLGWRNRDLEEAYLPFLRGQGIAQYTSDPVFRKLAESFQPDVSVSKPPVTPATIAMLLKQADNVPGSFLKNLTSGKALRLVRAFIHYFVRPSLNWENLAFLQDCTSLPIILKGILHPEDAKLAVQYGVQGILVSNHGGRQVDGAMSAIEALPKVVSAVEGKIPVWMDSGIRTGADMFKAIALGAQAVCLGRPYVYGLTLAGKKGVQSVIQHLQAEFELTMGLSGCKNIAEIRQSSLEERVSWRN